MLSKSRLTSSAVRRGVPLNTMCSRKCVTPETSGPSSREPVRTKNPRATERAAEARQLPAPRLTDREMEVLQLVAQGLNNRDIAKELFIAENTVKNHIRNILEKLHLHSRMEAVVYAVREKLLEIK